MTAQHSTAPWSIHETGAGYAIRRADDWHIAVAIQRDAHPVHGGAVSDAEAKANARLMRAAPAMLAALRETLRTMQDSDADDYFDASRIETLLVETIREATEG